MRTSLGTLYTRLSAQTAGYTSTLSKAVDEGVRIAQEGADKIEGAGEKMASALSDISDGFLAVSAAAGGAVAAAASLGGPVGDAVDNLKNTMLVLAQSVATALLPLLRELDVMAKRLVSAWRGLDNETKAQVVSFVRFSAIAGTALTVLSKSVVVAKGLFEAFVVAAPAIGGAATALGAFAAKAMTANLSLSGAASGIGASLAKLGTSAAGFVGMLAPLLALAAAATALVLLAGALSKGWQMFGTEISGWLTVAADKVLTLGANVAQFFADMWRGLAKVIALSAATVLDLSTAQFRRLASVAGPVLKAFGMTGPAAILGKVERMTGDQLVADFARGAQSIFDAYAQGAKEYAKAARESLTFSLGFASEGAKDLLGGIGQQVKDTLTGLIPSLDLSGRGVEDVPRDFKAEQERRDKLNDVWMNDAAGIQAGEFKAALEADAASASELFRAMEEDAKAVSDAASFAYEAEMDARAEYVASIRAAGESAAEADAAIREEAERLRRQRAEEVKGALSGFGNTLGGRMGDVSGVANSFAQGATVAGPMGGVAAAALDLATQSETFKSIVDVLNGALGAMAEILGSVLTPLRPVAGALGTIGVALATAIQPILKVVADALGLLAPPLQMVGKLVQALAPVFTMLNFGFQAMKLGMDLLEPVMKVLFEVLKWTGVVILTVAKAFMEAWNAVSEVINHFIDQAKKVYESIGWGGMAATLDQLKVGTIDTSGINQDLLRLKHLNWDDAMKGAADAADDFARAANDAADAMLNVPSWWKVNRAMANSADAGQGGRRADEEINPATGRPYFVDDGYMDSRDVGWAVDNVIPKKAVGTDPAGGGAYASAAPTTVNNISISGYDIDKSIDEAVRFVSKTGEVTTSRVGGPKFAVGMA